MNKALSKKIYDWSLTGSANEINGGEILRHIGSEVIYAKFTKNSKTGEWDNELQTTTIDYIGDYDPMTGTYKARHTLKDGTKIENRIMSAGFEWNNPEETGKTSRLIPMSEHYRIMELNMYFDRLKDNYFNNTGVLGLEQIESLAKNKSNEGLRNLLWIAAVIDSNTDLGVKEGILTFRITEVFNFQKRLGAWMFNLRDEKGSIVNVSKFSKGEDGIWVAKDFSYGGEIVGDLKIIDIQSPKEGDDSSNE